LHLGGVGDGGEPVAAELGGVVAGGEEQDGGQRERRHDQEPGQQPGGDRAPAPARPPTPTAPGESHGSRSPTTLKARTGAWKPLRATSPTSSRSAASSTAALARALMRIWPGSARSQSRAARFTTL